jgi:hypothetical protein
MKPFHECVTIPSMWEHQGSSDVALIGGSEWLPPGRFALHIQSGSCTLILRPTAEELEALQRLIAAGLEAQKRPAPDVCLDGVA